jgi:hypothetical protein
MRQLVSIGSFLKDFAVGLLMPVVTYQLWKVGTISESSEPHGKFLWCTILIGLYSKISTNFALKLGNLLQGCVKAQPAIVNKFVGLLV